MLPLEMITRVLLGVSFNGKDSLFQVDRCGFDSRHTHLERSTNPMDEKPKTTLTELSDLMKQPESLSELSEMVKRITELRSSDPETWPLLGGNTRYRVCEEYRNEVVEIYTPTHGRAFLDKERMQVLIQILDEAPKLR